MKNFFITLIATLVGVTLSLLILFGVAVGSVAVMIGGDDISTLKVESNSVLEISMSELITDAPLVSSLRDLVIGGGSTPSNLSLLSALLAIERAESDPNIVAISLRMDGLGGVSLANASELRTALLDFKKSSQKPIYAYAESYTQGRYYLATVADKIFIHPLGAIEWKGVGMSSLFYGDLANKLEIEPEIFRPKSNTYKSAIEPYTRSDFSAESRSQNLRLANSLWSSILRDVSLLHGATSESLNEVAESIFIVSADQAEQMRMVHYVSYLDEYTDALERVGVDVKDGKYNRIRLSKYSSLATYERERISGSYSKNSIAVIYIDGTIVDGVTDSSESDVIGSINISNQLREAREDDNIKGAVVRVNSPGGSAMAADVIWREMVLLQEVKPLIVSMGSYAASGGYYVSAPADVILASDYTITGSIGVYGLLFDAEKMLQNKLYITMDQVGSTPNANFGNLPNGVTPLQRAAINRGVDDIYRAFVSKVASGRNMTTEQIEAIAGGRVWSGVEAERIGLVDEIGGIKHALMLAMQRSDITIGEAKIVEMGEEPDELSMLLSIFSSHVQSIFDSEVVKGVSELKSILTRQSGVNAYSPVRVEF
ncbi:MAG: signal peptide peptidase SppA [Rikenellaceae bacterium]